MFISTNTTNMIITNVAGISIEFAVEDLNMNLKTRNDGLHLYTSRNKIDYPWYLVVDDVRNIDVRNKCR